MANFTIKYGDLIDNEIITAADLPAEWENFPDSVCGGVTLDFYTAFYDYYFNREIAGDTVPTFLRYLKQTTLEVADLLPAGLYGSALSEAAEDSENENVTRKVYPAPNGALDTAYILGGDTENRARTHSHTFGEGNEIMREGLPLVVWILKRYENCFMGVF